MTKPTKLAYLVLEDIDEDGGFGDAIPTKEPVIIFQSKSAAEKYVAENSNEHEYDRPYDSLFRGGLHVEEIDVGDSLPVLPKYVADLMPTWKDHSSIQDVYFYAGQFHSFPTLDEAKADVWIMQHNEQFARAWLDGYTVEEETNE